MADSTAKLAPMDEGSLWDELKRVVRPIILDVAVFVVIILALILGSWLLHLLEATGYEKDRVRTLEAMHYWCHTCVYCLFGVDLIFKTTLALFFRSSLRNPEASK